MTGAPYTLYRRKESRVWYARFRLPDGSWGNPRSTRSKKKRDALQWCEEYLRRHGQPVSRRRLTFAEFTAGFFDPGGAWERAKRAHNGSLRGAHLRNQKARLENYLLPLFGSQKIDEITAAQIDRALLDLRQNAAPKRRTETGKLSARTLNALHAALNAIFAEAVREGLIARNPMSEVPRMRERAKARGILTASELTRLLDPERASDIWGHTRYRLIFYIAVTTGARSGEIRTLRLEDLHPDHLVLRRSWDDVEGETTDTKTGVARTVPLHPSLHRDLSRWVSETGVEPGGYLFPSPKAAGAPIDRDSVLRNFRASLERAGITPEAQRRRNLTFHGLRHAAATLAIAEGVNPWLVRRMTGHRSSSVFERYLEHGEAADWSMVQAWQARLLQVNEG